MAIVTWDTFKSFVRERGDDDESCTRVLSRFASGDSELSELSLPAGLDFTLTKPITFNRKVGLKGTGTALGTNQAKIRVRAPGCVLNFPKGVRLENLSFVADGWCATEGIIRCGEFKDKGNEDDVDSSIKSCTINVGENNIGIHYNGRNCRVVDNAFSDGVRCTALKLTYKGIKADRGEKVQHGWRKNTFMHNQVHLGTSSTAIVTDGEYHLHDFLIAQNKFDIGCQVLYQQGKGGTYNITGNDWVGANKNFTGKQDSEAVIEFSEGDARGTISFNNFNATSVSNGRRPKNFVRVPSTAGKAALSLVGNTFFHCMSDKYAVKINATPNISTAVHNVVANDSRDKRGNGGFNWETGVDNNT